MSEQKMLALLRMYMHSYQSWLARDLQYNDASSRRNVLYAMGKFNAGYVMVHSAGIKIPQEIEDVYKSSEYEFDRAI